MKKSIIICNPTSGKGNKKNLIETFEEVLKNYGYLPTSKFTKYRGHAGKIVSELSDDIDLIVSLGGDGTFNEIVTGNMKREKKLLLSHIPLGTTNDLGALFGMGKDPIKNLKLVLEGQVKSLDICQINNHPFVYVAGIGKFTDIAYDTPRNQKKRWGYLAYIFNAFKVFNRKTQLFEMEITVNGETYKGLYSFVLICNASRMGGINVFQDVKMNDGKVEVLLTNVTKRKDIVKSLYFLATSDITKVPGFYFFRTENIKIKLHESPRKNWCIDGEELHDNETEFEIKVVQEIKMLLPTKELEKIFLKEAD